MAPFCVFIPYHSFALGSSFPLSLYEGLHDRVLSLPSTAEPYPSDLPDEEEAVQQSDLVALRRNQQQDLVTVNECKTALDEVLKSLQNKLDESDQNFLRGILKFADRAKKMPKSKLASCFHNFGAVGVSQTRATATSIVKKAKRGKIHIQPEAVKRRKLSDGTRRRQPQGQTARNNPFRPVAGKTKRSHQFAENVRRNEKVAKKAGRSKSTKTRIYEK